MDFKSNINENRENILKELEKFLKTETVVGDPINKGSGTHNEEEGAGGGLGVGAKISPDAVLVINKDEVTMMPIKGEANLDKLINKAPEILEKFNLKKEKEDDE